MAQGESNSRFVAWLNRKSPSIAADEEAVGSAPLQPEEIAFPDRRVRSWGWPFDRALRGPLRLRTLTTLRWLAVIGQTLTVMGVHFGFGYAMPLGFCLVTIAASAWLNLFVVFQFSPQRFLGENEAFYYIGFDIVQLCLILFFTGGLQNPFAILVLAPVTIAAGVLPSRLTVMLSALALVCLAILAVFHFPLPWQPEGGVQIPRVYTIGVWVALSFAVVFSATYSFRIANEAAQMRAALTATQMVIGREEKLSAIGGLAAAAAHELGTPLATIQVTAQEMSETVRDGDPASLSSQDWEHLREDADLVTGQARRCRDILGRLSERGEAGDLMHDQIRIDTILKEAADPFLGQNDDVDISFTLECRPPLTTPPSIARRPEIIYGLRNFIENAARFAVNEIRCEAFWDDGALSVAIKDDGPGFSPDALARLGEPYVTRFRGINPNRAGPRKEGMGLGFFIAKTLLERTGATIAFYNGTDALGSVSGAHVTVRWTADDVRAFGALSNRPGIAPPGL